MDMRVILVTIASAGTLSNVSNYHGDSAAELGRTVGATLLEAIHLQAKTRMWEPPACDAYPLAPEVKAICSALNRSADLFLKIGEGRGNGVASEDPYDQTAEYHLLLALQEGLSNKDPFIRFQTLAQVETICRGPLFSRARHSHCGAESERSALRILSEDDNHLNRHLALEILAEGRATVQSREALSAIVNGPKSSEGDCPEILPDLKTTGNRLPMARIAESFESGAYSCERSLARKALSIIKDRK